MTIPNLDLTTPTTTDAPKPEAIVVPGAPAPVAPPEQASQPDTPSTNALDDALRQLASNLSGQMAPTPAPGDLPPRDPTTGQFTKPEGEAPAPVETPAPADEPTAPGEAATDVGEEDIDPALIVELLPRHPDQEPIKLALDTPEMAERFRQTVNGAMRREQFDAAMQEVETRAQQIEQQETQLMVDPLAVVSEVLSEEQRDTMLLALLSDDRIYERLAPRLEQLIDPLGRRELRLDVREEYTNQRNAAADQVQQNRRVAQNIRQIKAAVNAIVPEHMNGPAADMWRRDALRELSAVTRQHNIQLLDPMQVPTALRARLVASGVDPAEAAERVARAVYTGRPTARTAAPNGSGAPRAAAPSALPAAPAAGTPTSGTRPVTALKAAHDRRVAAAAPAGAGVGTPSAGGLPQLPQGAGLDEALALVQSRVPRR